jgi:hypothetical protein
MIYILLITIISALYNVLLWIRLKITQMKNTWCVEQNNDNQN